MRIGLGRRLCCCRSTERIMTRYNLDHDDLGHYLPGGAPDSWTSGVDVGYASGIGDLFGVGSVSHTHTAIWRCGLALDTKWVVYQQWPAQAGSGLRPTSIAVLPDGTTCVAQHARYGLGGVASRWLIYDADGNEVASEDSIPGAGSSQEPVVTTDGTDFFILYDTGFTGWSVLQLDSGGSTVTTWGVGLSSTDRPVKGFVHQDGDLYIAMNATPQLGSPLIGLVYKMPIGAPATQIYSMASLGHGFLYPWHHCLHAGSDGHLYFGDTGFAVRSIDTGGSLRWAEPQVSGIPRITDDGTSLHYMGLSQTGTYLLADGTPGFDRTGGPPGIVSGLDMNLSANAIHVDGNVYVTHRYAAA